MLTITVNGTDIMKVKVFSLILSALMLTACGHDVGDPMRILKDLSQLPIILNFREYSEVSVMLRALTTAHCF